MSKLDRMLEGMKDYELDKNGGDKKMDEDEKDRLLKDVMKKIESEKMNMREQDMRRNKKGTSFRKSATKVAAAVGLVFITGNAVVFGASMLHLDDKFSSYFSQDKSNDDIIEENLRNVDAKAVNQGVTVQVDQVLGDDYGFYTLFNVKGVKNAERIMEPCFRDYEVKIKGSDDSIPISYNVVKVFDDKEDELSFMLKVNSQNLTGKEISFILKDLGDGCDGDFRKVVKGQWKLNWKLSYENNAKQLKVDKAIDLYGGKYNWDSISISPLSVSVSTTMIKQGIVHQSVMQGCCRV